MRSRRTEISAFDTAKRDSHEISAANLAIEQNSCDNKIGCAKSTGNGPRHLYEGVVL